MDLFLVHAYQDQEYASGLEDTLSGRGLVVGEPLSLWPGQRLLPLIDQRLHESRSSIVIVSKEFLKLSFSRKALLGITPRRKVIAILSDVGEEVVSRHSPRLAVAAISGSMSDGLVRLL